MMNMNNEHDEHEQRILVTNLRVLCFEICAIHILLGIEFSVTVLSKYGLNLVSEICLRNILTFSA